MDDLWQRMHVTRNGRSAMITETLLSEMKVVHVPPRHRHLPLQRMCRRHSGLTLHAGLIMVSDSQTAPWTLKMSLWNLCVCKLPIIPSVWRKSKVWWFVKWGECFAFCDLLMGVILKRLESYLPEEGESQVFKWRQINHILPHCVFPSAMRRTRYVSVSWNEVRVTKNSMIKESR